MSILIIIGIAVVVVLGVGGSLAVLAYKALHDLRTERLILAELIQRINGTGPGLPPR